ncbi:mitogen-activated protein kinase-binding protein 1 isoform X2 [Macrosteles quadrilineatus]|uniref:mitogen-activated protein kinase-binding protein 1 isoform X2 n=1 Tax=Macrosteles quadrilineatus TaxID=74068 RepID=UPI0023E1CAA5|nr:mitogen-activated protein kinase-binding protein 1 isoform X2 [Macrosteles quadrilineatus]XP_054279531.1 mitogen-activated protein kinase-binding protein 1 isoform X2 [Macrosteles quadrilineatus]
MGITPGPKVIRERDHVPAYDVKLERVLGLTVCTNSGLDCDPSSDTIAYPAGCTVVLFNPTKNRQSHVLNTSRKTVTCLRFSPDGRLLATGENGHLPSVRVWDLVDGTQVAEFTGHKYGISCVAFSPSQKYLVSVGCEHDMIVNVWEWKSGVKVASNKVSNKVKAVAFSENGNYFVTAGNRLVKFWYLEYSRSAKYKEPVPLMGRSAILGEQRNNDFCDVACGKGEMSDSTYAITRSGLLCEFNNRRLLDKWVELRTPCANCMTVSKTLIFIGCAEGIVRCFSPQTLQYITTLPRPHYLGVDIAQGTNISHTTTHPNNAKYPDAIAVSFDENNMKLTCVYNDHSLYIWDVKDIKRVGKTHSFLYHSACIWGVEMYPDSVKNSAMPLGSFLTCSSDDTIRVWNLDSPDPQVNTRYRTNIYSNELLKVMYVDPEMNFLKDMDITKGEKGDSTSYDGRNGVRSIRISPDGKHLASGDREGNIRITDLHSLEEIVRIEAHDGEVLCVEYSNFDDPRKKYLASASRDRLIHVFSVDEGYKLVQTLDDHSSSITAVRFLSNNNQLQMVSCGADKSIIFRTLQRNIPGSDVQHTFVREQITAAKTTLYDMEGDCTQKHVLTACQDRNIRVYSINTSKHTKTFKGSVGEDGSLIKISLDPSGILVATSCTDKTLSIYDYYNTECVATMLGHSELATGLRFTRDCRRLISASGDGCIFVWKMPHDLMVTMRARLAQQVARAGKKLAQLGITIGDNDNIQENNININSTHQGSNDSDYRLNMGQLPQWAQKSILDTNIPIIEKSSRSVEAPKGRWAQRAHLEPNYDVPILDRNFYTQGSMSKERRLDSDGSKEDSSIDSGTELRSFKHEKRKQFGVAQITDIKESIMKTEHIEMSHQRNRHHTDDSSIGSFKYEDLESTEHDGDVEDISEGESLEETRHQLIYYPPAEDTNSDYTVNAMDVEELRKSQRRAKRPDLLLAHGEASQSVSGSQESDDDEQASTPSGEHSDRKITGSTESLNIMSRREKVLKNTFESLSGAEMEKDPTPKNKTSLSARYMSGSGVRNSNVIQAARVTKHEAQSTSKREELQRRIEETRRQLQCVGYRSNLESSQSIQDLSPRGMSYHDSRKMSSLKPSFQVPNIVIDADGSGGIRRACSLSDLSNTPSKLRTVQPSQSVATGKSINVRNTRNSSRHTGAKPSSTITRSTSVGTLNQSDSESEQSHSQSVRRVMRPTISSLNKAISGQKSSTLNRRRGMTSSYSSMALNKPDNEDSSSEEGKNNCLPQQRSSSTDRSGTAMSRRVAPASGLGRSGSERDLAHSQRLASRTLNKPVRSASGMVRSTSNLEDASSKAAYNVDFDNTPVPQLLDNMKELLDNQQSMILEFMNQMQRRLADETVDMSERSIWKNSFQEAIQEYIKSLSKAAMTNKIQEALDSLPSDSASNSEVVSMVQQCSDILISMVQQKMSEPKN